MLTSFFVVSHLVLYDGVCGLCDRFVQFLIRIDRHDRLRFAALQSPLGARVLISASMDPSALSTVVVVPDFGGESERIFVRSDAAIFAIASVGGAFGAFRLFRAVPRFLRDAAYGAIARTRYRVFGRLDSCPVPTPAMRAKFLDLAPSGRGR